MSYLCDNPECFFHIEAKESYREWNMPLIDIIERHRLSAYLPNTVTNEEFRMKRVRRNKYYDKKGNHTLTFCCICHKAIKMVEDTKEE